MIYRVKFENRDLKPMWDDNAYWSQAAAMRAYRSAVADPDPAWGSVYVTAQGIEDEWETVVIGCTFV